MKTISVDASNIQGGGIAVSASSSNPSLIPNGNITVSGSGFLYNMVRTMAGTLLDVGSGRRAPEEVDEIIASRDRRRAGPTAPARGLYLLRVFYPESLFRSCGGGPHRPPGLFGSSSA